MNELGEIKRTRKSKNKSSNPAVRFGEIETGNIVHHEFLKILSRGLIIAGFNRYHRHRHRYY